MTDDATSENAHQPSHDTALFEGAALVARVLGWMTLGVLAVFLLNDFLTYWRGWPGALGKNGDAADIRQWIQIGLYAAAMLAAPAYVLRNKKQSLRAERDRICNVNALLIRSAFWAVLLIGLADFTLAFLRGEELLVGITGAPVAKLLMQTEFRGSYIHMSLVAVSVAIATLTRSIGVIWLALLIVAAEFLLVMSRYVFSYEQDYMADLVRFWYAALFMVGCAYTLRGDGHVRIDVVYANLSTKSKGLINAIGSLVLGMPFCWLILAVGTSGKTGIINSALLTYEIEGLGNGLYLFYLMTVLMGVFAVTMLIELVGLFFDAVADCRGEPGGRSHEMPPIQ